VRNELNNFAKTLQVVQASRFNSTAHWCNRTFTDGLYTAANKNYLSKIAYFQMRKFSIRSAILF